MNMSVTFPNSKSKHLNPEQTAEFGRRVDEIRREIMDSLGEQDAKYIYKIRNFVRYSEIASRAMLMFGGWMSGRRVLHKRAGRGRRSGGLAAFLVAIFALFSVLSVARSVASVGW